jgi:hypothetical protein
VFFGTSFSLQVINVFSFMTNALLMQICPKTSKKPGFLPSSQKEVGQNVQRTKVCDLLCCNNMDSAEDQKKQQMAERKTAQAGG